MTTLEFRRLTAAGWGEWLVARDQRVPAGAALYGYELAELGDLVTIRRFWHGGGLWEWRPMEAVTTELP
jgi:hypothetical protein